MKASLQNKLESILAHSEELRHHLSDPQVIQNPQHFTKLSKEYASIEPIVQAYSEYKNIADQLTDTEAMLQDSDPEMRDIAKEEKLVLLAEQEVKLSALQTLLLPTDPNDKANIFIEIRAGAGGDEASIFAGNLFRAYARYAEKKRWTIEIINQSEGEHGGYKEIIARIMGNQIYGKLKFESGTHRVQRVPATEAQGRVHTSTCTVAILPEIEEIEAITINPADLRVDTYRSSGAGGQHVNKTDSAIRITHLPSGIVVECQEERSQHKNRSKAMSLLSSKLLQAEQEKQQKERAQTRRLQVGTGDRAERIRTYNYPQSRVTDHRINLTLHHLDQIMEGDMDAIIEPLLHEHHADLLAEMEG